MRFGGDNWGHFQVDSMQDDVIELMLFFLDMVMVLWFLEMCPCFHEMQAKVFRHEASQYLQLTFR